MINLSKLTLCFLLIISCFSSKAQRTQLKFGEVSSIDFESKTYPIDPDCNAIILGHFGEAHYEGDSKGGFSIIYKKHLRVRLLNRKAFDKATMQIPLYVSDNGLEERVDKIDAFTFNYINGVVEKTKLDNGSIFKEKVDKNHIVKKFTMPNLQEGCIIDIRYTVNSAFERNLESWLFQDQYPTLWSEYVVSIPEIYDFIVLSQGYHPFKVKESKNSASVFNMVSPGGSEKSEFFKYTGKVTTTTWAMENVPALKPEDFTTTIQNHLAKIGFQLSKIQYPEAPVKYVMNNWTVAAEDFMKHPSFGEELKGNLGWLKSEVKIITENKSTQLDAAKAIYAYVRDNFTCTSHYGVYKNATLKKIFQTKSGTVADINLLLTAMFLAQGLDAHPVIASTRSNGIMYDIYPIQERMNYVISQVSADGKIYNLDGSYKRLGFAHLPANCYNGSARLIHTEPAIVNLASDSLIEQKFTSIIFLNGENNSFNGILTSTLGKVESYSVREKLANSEQAEFAKELAKNYSSDIKFSDAQFNQLKELEEPVVIKYNLKMELDEDIIYLNPLFAEATKNNPFKAAERYYPVEMPYAMNELIVVRMDIPKGYTVDEMPKSTRVKFNEDEGMFEYLISKDADIIQVRTVIKLNKANFIPEDYQSLRDFFAFIVKKHSEQIVLKKIKS